MSIRLHRGDITKLNADAIVNAANSGLMGGGGVDGAIHRAGGPSILDECKAIRSRMGECPAGQAVLTGGGNLKAKYVIHAVGPVWHGGNHKEGDLLALAYRNSLLLAEVQGVHTIAFPNISTGIYGFPKPRAAEIAIRTVRLFLNERHLNPDEVVFCCFDEENHNLYRNLLGQD